MEESNFVNCITSLSAALVSAFADPAFEARQKEKERILNSCPLVEWVADMGRKIPFCKNTGEFCNYCKGERYEKFFTR